MQTWLASLPDHLRFSQENLDKQIDMFETGSTTSAWCYCFIHALHPCYILELTDVSVASRCAGKRVRYSPLVVRRRADWVQNPSAGFETSWT